MYLRQGAAGFVRTPKPKEIRSRSWHRRRAHQNIASGRASYPRAPYVVERSRGGAPTLDLVLVPNHRHSGAATAIVQQRVAPAAASEHSDEGGLPCVRGARDSHPDTLRGRDRGSECGQRSPGSTERKRLLCHGQSEGP